jgi:hypothetical protein
VCGREESVVDAGAGDKGEYTEVVKNKRVVVYNRFSLRQLEASCIAGIARNHRNVCSFVSADGGA